MKYLIKWRLICITCLTWLPLKVVAQDQIRKEALRLPECVKPFGKDSLRSVETFASLEQYLNNKDYIKAYEAFSYLYCNSPCLYKNTYVYAPIILSRLIDNRKNSVRTPGLIDTLLSTFPARIKYFGEDAQVKAPWAMHLGRYRPEKAMEALKLYREFFEVEKNNMIDPIYVKDYMRQAIQAHRQNQFGKDSLFTLYNQLTELTESNKTKHLKDSQLFRNWNNTSLLIDRMMNQFLKCEDIEAIYRPKIELDSTNFDLMVKVIRLYKSCRPACPKNAYLISLLERTFSIKPNAAAAEELAYYYEKRLVNDKTNFYFEKAAELSNNKIKQVKFYLILAKRNIENPELAKKYNEKGLAINPQHGASIIAQGIILYKTACGDKFDQAMAACAAVELFNKAISVDPTCESDAKKEIEKYKAFFPNKKELEKKGLKEGDDYTIECLGLICKVKYQE